MPDSAVDISKRARNLLRWVLTLGSALIYAVLVMKVSLDVWVGNDPTTVTSLLGGVMNSLSLTFGSALIGWFGLTANSIHLTYDTALSGWPRKLQVLKALFTQLAGAAILAMFIYLLFGAFAGVTYLFHPHNTPTLLITVGTTWAAQASAIVASTLSAVLKPDAA